MIEIERILSESARLNARLAQASDSQAREAETRRALALLKARIQSLLTSQDYRWPADLPFVRVPKSTVRSFDLTVPFAPPGTVQATARELLGLTAHERQTIEAALTRYFDEVSQRIQSVVYETNRPLQGNLPVGAAASRVFAVPALGQDIIQASERMVAEIAANLGEERWNLIKPGTDLQGSHSLRRILSLDAAQNSQQLILWITQKENTPPKVGYGWTSANGGGFGAEGTDLAVFAPANTSPKSFLQDTLLPAALIERGTRWLTQEAEARLSTQSNP